MFHLVCNFQNIDEAWLWVNGLLADGSTNTSQALQVAYQMDGVEAIYLLTDGRPDQVCSQSHLNFGEKTGVNLFLLWHLFLCDGKIF